MVETSLEISHFYWFKWFWRIRLSDESGICKSVTPSDTKKFLNGSKVFKLTFPINFGNFYFSMPKV